MFLMFVINVKLNFLVMTTSVFHSFMSSMLMDLSTIQRSFEENEIFPSDSVMALSLEGLANKLDNLRIFLVSGYEGKESK